VLGIERYGSADNFQRRIAAEFVVLRPHPQFVPTPLSTDAPLTEVGMALGDTEALPPIATVLPDVILPVHPESAPRVSANEVAPTLPAPVAAAPSPPVRPVVPTITPSPAVRAPSPPPASATPPPKGPQVEPATTTRLSGLTHTWQTWNNCGPATLAMALSYFGRRIGQQEIGAHLRPDPDDKNVSLEEMAAYARGQGLAAVARANGDAERIRRLIRAGVPVLIETWHEPKPNDGMGHYRLLIGFDDAAGQWVAYDSFDTRDLVKGQPYAGIRLPYDETERLWSVFNRQYLVIYDAARTTAVEQVLGEDRDSVAAHARALAQAQAAVQSQPNDAFAWFNLGSDLVAVGRFKEASQAFDRARRIGLPWRMLWYQFGPYRAYYETGRHDEVIALANATIATARQAEEAFYWRGLSEKAKGDAAAARASWERALQLNPRYADAANALSGLDRPQ
jgi:tetratricopeptide (TPR) repeat protein